MKEILDLVYFGGSSEEILGLMPIILSLSFILGVVGILILLYKETVLEGATQPLTYAILSYTDDIKYLWAESKYNSSFIILVLFLVGWAIFLVALLPTALLRLFGVVMVRQQADI